MANVKEIKVPDIGGATDVDVIDILVKVGSSVQKDDALVTLEGDKATMDIPSPLSGVVESITLKIGDKVSQGSLILKMTTTEEISPVKEASKPEVDVVPNAPDIKNAEPAENFNTSEDKPARSLKQPETIAKTDILNPSQSLVSAGPSTRRYARELGVMLEDVSGTGRKARVSKEDVARYVKAKLQEPSSQGFSLPSQPMVDFSQYGGIEIKPLNKIKRLTAVHVQRSSITIPHVTQFDSADITELEAFRVIEAERAKASGFKLTLLAFVCKVVCKALAVFPQFNASLDESGENLIYKQYYNLGIAVETPNGLVVPVLKGVDQLSINDIAQEMARLSNKAREKGLSPADMSGGCFTLSSLGGIGGTAFTPIVNSPEVAILGLSRASMQPVYSNGEFKPRLILPLSLSYDHRVIDGAEGARFVRFISESLGDIRRILLYTSKRI